MTPDPDLMAARPDLMLAAAAAYERAAHQVHSLAEATARSANALLAEWKGRGAEGFANQMGHLAVATPEAAQALLGVATTLRTLAPRVAEAQALARRAMLLDEEPNTIVDGGRLRAVPASGNVSLPQSVMDRANELNRSANVAATAAFDAVTATAPSVKAAAVLASAVKKEPTRGAKIAADQVRLVTQPDGRRVYSFDGGLAIPVDLPGAHKFVEDLKAYLPRFLAGARGGIDVPAHLSARGMWFELAYVYTLTTMGEIPERIRSLLSIGTSSSITLRQVAGYSMLGANDGVAPTRIEPELAPKGSDFLNNGDVPPEAVINEEEVQADQRLGTQTAFRGESQQEPGGQDGPSVSIKGSNGLGPRWHECQSFRH